MIRSEFGPIEGMTNLDSLKIIDLPTDDFRVTLPPGKWMVECRVDPWDRSGLIIDGYSLSDHVDRLLESERIERCHALRLMTGFPDPGEVYDDGSPTPSTIYIPIEIPPDSSVLLETEESILTRTRFQQIELYYNWHHVETGDNYEDRRPELIRELSTEIQAELSELEQLSL